MCWKKCFEIRKSFETQYVKCMASTRLSWKVFSMDVLQITIQIQIFTQLLRNSCIFRSEPSATTPSYQWPTSPILPPISSRTPHLVPVTFNPHGTSSTSPSSSTPVTTTATTTMASNSSSIVTNSFTHRQQSSWIAFTSTHQSLTSSTSSSSLSKYTKPRRRSAHVCQVNF